MLQTNITDSLTRAENRTNPIEEMGSESNTARLRKCLCLIE